MAKDICGARPPKTDNLYWMNNEQYDADTKCFCVKVKGHDGKHRCTHDEYEGEFVYR